ncbi:Heme oxygenase [Ruegeria sp. THAF33]|nr:Heme oxygenase [Ruegeria sp. THAF33]
MKALSKMDGQSLRAVLRNETDVLHNKLHAQFSFAALLDGTLQRSEYRALIQRLYGFYAPLDDAVLKALTVDDVSAPTFWYEKRSRLIAQDIRDLEGDHDNVSTGPTCREIAQVVTPKTVGGVLYVVEGATMGGALINKAAEKLLSTENILGRRYWDWCRVEGRNRWRMTLQYLDHLQSSASSLDDVVSGAKDTFRLLDDWLAPLDPRPKQGAV